MLSPILDQFNKKIKVILKRCLQMAPAAVFVRILKLQVLWGKPTIRLQHLAFVYVEWKQINKFYLKNNHERNPLIYSYCDETLAGYSGQGWNWPHYNLTGRVKLGLKSPFAKEIIFLVSSQLLISTLM